MTTSKLEPVTSVLKSVLRLPTVHLLTLEYVYWRIVCLFGPLGFKLDYCSLSVLNHQPWDSESVALAVELFADWQDTSIGKFITLSLRLTRLADGC